MINAGQEDEKDVKGHASKIYTKLKEAFLLREKQMKYLIAQLKHSPYRIILGGDFNDTPSSYIYWQITGLLQDTFTEKGVGLSATYLSKGPLFSDKRQQFQDFKL